MFVFIAIFAKCVKKEIEAPLTPRTVERPHESKNNW